mmetsp:Transcript_30886/g.65103  ORF Transcript_30886/g.65103 Transcript_30886/m.65103 type:complete len:359 (+) Transcript_30886:89-1165(+)
MAAYVSLAVAAVGCAQSAVLHRAVIPRSGPLKHLVMLDGPFILPPAGMSNQASTRRRMKQAPAVDVLPQSAQLSEETVAQIFELVWRDTRMVARTAPRKPGFAAELVRDRLPIALWYAKYNAERLQLDLNEKLAKSAMFRLIAPHAAAELHSHRQYLQKKLDCSRAALWPTLRVLLLTQTTQRRVIEAARTQALLFSARHGRLRILSPRRLVMLWASLLGWLGYALRWLWLDVASRGSLPFAERRNRLRVHLIERAIERGLELVKRLETVDESVEILSTLSERQRASRLRPPSPRRDKGTLTVAATRSQRRRPRSARAMLRKHEVISSSRSQRKNDDALVSRPTPLRRLFSSLARLRQ